MRSPPPSSTCTPCDLCTAATMEHHLYHRSQGSDCLRAAQRRAQTVLLQHIVNACREVQGRLSCDKEAKKRCTRRPQTECAARRGGVADKPFSAWGASLSYYSNVAEASILAGPGGRQVYSLSHEKNNDLEAWRLKMSKKDESLVKAESLPARPAWGI